MVRVQAMSARRAVAAAIVDRRRVMLVLGDPSGRSLACRALEGVPDAIRVEHDGTEMVLLHTHDGGEARCPLERVLLVESDEAIARSAR